MSDASTMGAQPQPAHSSAVPPTATHTANDSAPVQTTTPLADTSSIASQQQSAHDSAVPPTAAQIANSNTFAQTTAPLPDRSGAVTPQQLAHDSSVSPTTAQGADDSAVPPTATQIANRNMFVQTATPLADSGSAAATPQQPADVNIVSPMTAQLADDSTPTQTTAPLADSTPAPTSAPPAPHSTFDFDGTLASPSAGGVAEEAAPYSFENPPPVRNYPLYWWHITAKILSFALFGVGAVLISIVAFPVMMLLFPSKRRFRKAGHRFISAMFRFFTLFMTVIRASHVTAKERGEFKKLKSCIVVANHPSLLDVVMLISLLPDADCIVNAYLVGKNILHIIARKLYIPAADSFEEIMEKSVESLKSGSVLIIFPEGTRSKPSGQNPYKKGAARVALASGCPIVPVYIGGNDKRGLRKHDPMLKYNTRRCYHYDIHMKPPIKPEDYKDLPEPAAARRMTARLREVLSDDANREYITIYGNDKKP